MSTTKELRVSPAAACSRPVVVCGCCQGEGTTELGDDLWRTLQRLDGKPRTTQDLVEIGITRNAINNRLIDLEKHGLIKCTGKRGKWRLWVAANATDQATASTNL
jgi:hypothetical protein